MTSSPRRRSLRLFLAPASWAVGAFALCATGAVAAPRVIVVSLDGATPRFVDQYLASGALSPNEGLGLLDYTVPFGAFAGIGAVGFSLTASDFAAAPPATVEQLVRAGRAFWSPVLFKTSALETFTVGGVGYDIRVAALDTTNDGRVNYDTLVFFDARQGIPPGTSHSGHGAPLPCARTSIASHRESPA